MVKTLSFQHAADIAERFHNVVKPLYQSHRARFVAGTYAVQETEWIKDGKGKWNGYPPAKWHNPAVFVNKLIDEILITSSRNKTISIQFPPAGFVVTSGLQGEAVKTISKDKKELFFWTFEKERGLNKYKFKKQSNSVRLPDDYIFAVDKLGLKIIQQSSKADYHIPAGNSTSVQTWIEKLEINKNKRQQAANEAVKNKQIYKKCLKSGLKIGLIDSLSAGNCVSGTEQFCRNHKLNKNKWYSPIFVLNKALAVEKQRVRLAINMAIKRHLKFIETGAEVFYPAV